MRIVVDIDDGWADEDARQWVSKELTKQASKGRIPAFSGIAGAVRVAS